MQTPLYIEEEIDIDGQVFVKVGFGVYIDRITFSEVISLLKHFDCYYIREDKSWFLPKQNWKIYLSELKRQIPSLFDPETQSIKEKLAQAVKKQKS